MVGGRVRCWELYQKEVGELGDMNQGPRAAHC